MERREKAKLEAARAKAAAKAEKQATKVIKTVTKVLKSKKNTAVPKTPLTGKVFVFSGFRDDQLKTQIELLGATVGASLTKKTTHIVYVETAKNKAKQATLTLPKSELAKFVEKYGLKHEAKPKAAKKPKSEKMPTPDLGLTKFAQNKSYYVYNKDPAYNKVVLPLKSYEASKFTYAGTTLGQIKRHADGVAEGMFAKENNVRGILPHLFYVSKKDLFILVLRTRSTKEPKVTKKNDYFGVEFKYDPTMKYKISMEKNAIVLFENAEGKLKTADLVSAVHKEHPSAVLALTTSKDA